MSELKLAGGPEKVMARFVCLEANYISTDNAFQNLHSRWEQCEDIFLWEGGVKEEANSNADTHLLGSLSQQ